MIQVVPVFGGLGAHQAIAVASVCDEQGIVRGLLSVQRFDQAVGVYRHHIAILKVVQPNTPVNARSRRVRVFWQFGGREHDPSGQCPGHRFGRLEDQGVGRISFPGARDAFDQGGLDPMCFSSCAQGNHGVIRPFRP